VEAIKIGTDTILLRGCEMPRIPRIVFTGYPHHITQRGNYKQKTFTGKVDYKWYLKLVKKYSSEYELSLLAYCLMPNHVHFIVIPKNADSLAKTFGVCHTLYSQYYNKKNLLTGHLWQGRFYSCVLDEKHLYAVIRYVETNPVRAELVRRPEDWEWSSAGYHLKQTSSKLPLEKIDNFANIYDWQKYLQIEDETVTTKIRTSTLTGRPLGDETFVTKLERLIGKQLKPPPQGRPCKNMQK
jgi:putative transposase